MSEEIRVGLIGVGTMGREHAQRFIAGEVPHAALTAIANNDAEVARVFPGTRFFASGSELIQSGEVDAVIIATPHRDHPVLAIEALAAGLHVLVEKPIAVQVAEAERMIAAHTDRRLVFAAMFNQRTDPLYRRLKSLLEGGELGRIHRIQWVITDWFRPDAYYASGGWRGTWAGEGGGVLLNQSAHQLDLWAWLFGLPESVWADCEIGRFHDIEVEDRVTAVMKYADGTSGVFITTTGEAPGVNRLEIAAERGQLILEGRQINGWRNAVSSTEFLRTSALRFGKPEHRKFEELVEGSGEQHLGVLKNFVAAIRGEAPLLAPAAEGLWSVELANAMLLSSFEGGTPVRLPIDRALYARHLRERIQQGAVPRGG